jgi:hypothetical protein
MGVPARPQVQPRNDHRRRVSVVDQGKLTCYQCVCLVQQLISSQTASCERGPCTYATMKSRAWAGYLQFSLCTPLPTPDDLIISHIFSPVVELSHYIWIPTCVGPCTPKFCLSPSSIPRKQNDRPMIVVSNDPTNENNPVLHTFRSSTCTYLSSTPYSHVDTSAPSARGRSLEASTNP